jgi:hypothetical protein
MRKNYPYIILSIILFILCVLIVILFSSHQFIRGFLGDAVIVMLLYTFLKSWRDINAFWLSVWVTIFAYVIEITQYFKIIRMLGFEENFFTRIVFGSVFDPLDLLAYTIGGVSIYILDTRVISRR